MEQNFFSSAVPEILIRPAAPGDFDNIDKLCDKRFGEGYLHRGEFYRWLKYPKLFSVALFDGAFAGFAFLMPEDAVPLAAYMKISAEDVKAFSGGKPVLHCRSAALVPEYEHHGLMYRLLSEILDNARVLGYGAAFAPAWKYKDKVPMGRLLDKLGFEKMCERQMLWYDQADYKCVACGGRCSCDAVIYRKKI